MSRGGGSSQWERQVAAQRREAERQARERARWEKEQEKGLKQRHLESQQRAAEAKAAGVEQQIKVLDEMLTSTLPLAPFSFNRMMVTPEIPRFDPGSLGVTPPAPSWSQYAPAEPGGLSRLFGGAARHEHRVAEARAQFDAAMLDYERAEEHRLAALSGSQEQHERKVLEVRFAAGDAEAAEWFVSRVLDASRYPNGFPRQYQVAYRPENRDVVIEFEFPRQQVVPKVRGYRYVKIRDAIDPLPRPETEIKQRYARLIASIALRTLHEVFAATPSDVVEAVVFNGRVSTIDRSTGKPDRPHLLSVSAERSVFEDLVLASVHPAASLTRLT